MGESVPELCVFIYSHSLYRATCVPVGEDQVQHLEFARECANNFNSMHGAVLTEPHVLLCKEIHLPVPAYG